MCIFNKFKERQRSTVHSEDQYCKCFCASCAQEISLDLNPFEWFLYEDVLCKICRSQLHGKYRKLVKQKTEIHYLYEYKDFFRDLMIRYKEKFDVKLAPLFLSDHRSLIYKLSKNKSVVCVPSDESKKIERGFSVCERILDAIKIEYEPCLEKRSDSIQKEKSRSERAKIGENLLLVSIPLRKQVFLFDDVCTTGNTMYSCKLLLESKGCSVMCFSLSNVIDSIK